MPLSESDHISTDVLIIDAGLAGCRAAIAAAKEGTKEILMLSKRPFMTRG